MKKITSEEKAKWARQIQAQQLKSKKKGK